MYSELLDRSHSMSSPSSVNMLRILVLLSVGLAAASEVEKRSSYATGLVSQACLECICQLESGGCRPIGCNMDEGTLSCGYFQIKEPYWIDCGRPGTGWKACADDIHCATQCIQNYMKRYATHYHCPMTCQGYAREHNGGPQGCHDGSTVNYWHNVLRQPGCSHVH